MTSFDYDDFDDNGNDEITRERAFELWQRHGTRCNGATLRAALWHAQDLDDPLAVTQIMTELERRRRG